MALSTESMVNRFGAESLRERIDFRCELRAMKFSDLLQLFVEHTPIKTGQVIWHPEEIADEIDRRWWEIQNAALGIDE